MQKTYTTAEARARLNVSPSTFDRYRLDRYRKAFVVIRQGAKGRGNTTEFDAAAIDSLRKWLKMIRKKWK